MDARVLRTPLQKLLYGASIEITPKAAAALRKGDLQSMFPGCRKVFVTMLANSTLEETLQTCQLVTSEGHVAVPHLCARSLASERQLLEALERCHLLGVREYLCIGGGQRNAVGPFTKARDILGPILSMPDLQGVHFAGHPEGHPHVKSELMVAALVDKIMTVGNRVECRVYTQFCLDVAPIQSWAEEVRLQCVSAGLPEDRLQVVVGLAGPAKLQTLLKFAATTAGFVESARFLSHHKEKSLSLLMIQNPNEMLYQLVKLQQDRLASVNGIHFYPFGGVEACCRWLKEIQEQNTLV